LARRAVTTEAIDPRVTLNVLTAVKRGDFSARMPANWTGPAARVAAALNEIIESNQRLERELHRLSKRVGKEGQMKRAPLGDAGGAWASTLDAINDLIEDLARPNMEMGRVIRAVAAGDLSQTMPLEIDGRRLQGQFLNTAKTVNTLVDQLRLFANEVTRVAREVGTEGKLGGQAEVKGVGGAWKELTDNVNTMASNLTSQVRNIAEVTTAVQQGDLSKKITVDVQGELLELKNTVNTMVDQLNAFANEVTRVAGEVGTEGKLGGQAEVEGVGGVWKDLTDNVNSMAGNLTSQVRNIAEVTTAVQQGDLSKKITVDVQGEILELKNTINVMVDQLNAFANEVTRVAREVGTEGKLGGQAKVEGVAGIWKDLTDNVNFMAGNLTSQVRNIAEVTTAVQQGDLSKKITVDVEGEILELKNTINLMVDQLNAFALEVTRVAREVGTEGQLGGQAEVEGVAGIWKDLTDNVNTMASNLTSQVRNIAEVTTAVQQGDLSRKITVDVRGEILELKNTINVMVDQLNAFANEVTRVAFEVGTEGKLGGQADVEGVGGIWKDLTDNVNTMASNLTAQVRGIARVVTAVANGELEGKLVLEAKGEIAELADTINSMTDTLATFADQVSTVAREVGVEGRLGGQASVPGAAGTWRDLTDNVNRLSATLTTQVRAIAEVATAVTEGDLTRSIGVEASGEVAVLKDNINEMIRNLRETTQKTKEQDWLKTNLARFTRMLQGQRDLLTVSRLILSELAPLINAEYGAFYGLVNPDSSEPYLMFQAGYAYKPRKDLAREFRLGEGLIGQCALDKRPILLTNVPPDYIRITSGLGQASPLSILILPVLFEGEVRAVIELASFQELSPIHRDFLDQLTDSIGVVLNNIQANGRTESLLRQSQSLANELQSQQDQLQRTNADLEEKANQLANQNAEVEQKRAEVEDAKNMLEEKAEQLAVTSRYKSEFLANMSHELRTPLNSLLILAQELAENPDGNLLPKQVEYATIIRSSGSDLLKLINDILDISKIESGTVALEISDFPVADIEPLLERTFRHVADVTKLAFTIELDPTLPTTIPTDPQRLQQILNNLLSNAFKFTEKGKVEFRAAPATKGWTSQTLSQAEGVVALSVTDTGIGIPLDMQRSIFEAFSQGDGTTSRKFGGTGLGLSICRELVGLLGGEITLKSQPGKGSTFTVYLPAGTTPPLRRRAADASSNGAEEHPSTPSTPEPALVGAATQAPRAERTATAARPASAKSRRRRVDEIVIAEPVAAGEGKALLVVEDDAIQRQHIVSLVAPLQAHVVSVATGEEAVAELKGHRFDVAVIDLGLPGMSGWDVIERIRSTKALRSTALVVYTARDLNREEELKLAKATRSVVVKEVRSAERLRDEISSLLTQPQAVEVTSQSASNGGPEPALAGKKVLVVDDDIRNIFALTAMLERQGMQVIAVDNGQDAVSVAREEDDISIALVDVMMPEMDGFATMSHMRQLKKFKNQPIVALTAKAMKGDREKCIEAGASDYIAKPVNSAHLITMLRAWLSG